MGVSDGQLPREREQAEVLARMIRQREAAERVVAHLHACFGPCARGRERHHLGAALIDVVLHAIGDHVRRRGHHIDIEGLANPLCARRVVRDGGDDDARLAVVQRPARTCLPTLTLITARHFWPLRRRSPAICGR